jgi:crossover junction endodeoxyribonuclease RusA
MKITFDLPWPDRNLSPNARIDYHKKAKHAAAARSEGHYLALEKLQAMGLQTTQDGWTIQVEALTKTALQATVVLYPPDRAHRDDDNCLAMLKPYRDGIFEAMALDDHAIRETTIKWGDPIRNGRVVYILQPFTMPAEFILEKLIQKIGLANDGATDLQEYALMVEAARTAAERALAGIETPPGWARDYASKNSTGWIAIPGSTPAALSAGENLNDSSGEAEPDDDHTAKGGGAGPGTIYCECKSYHPIMIAICAVCKKEIQPDPTYTGIVIDETNKLTDADWSKLHEAIRKAQAKKGEAKK